ncbi:TIGR04222 domain-containing membrane protein [Actinosynnema sp. NPDC050436]|uniref:TIGR04222 domain-containing membrane protein n=1 Tax=Actinosynnema sp. NPDC050436 TaxID=3155659 RepID=UPI0033CE9D29
MAFLWWYGPALVLAVLLGLRLKRVTGSAPVRPPTFEEVGYLGGGPVRAAEVAVAGLVADNRARLSGGAVSAVPAPEPGPSTALQDVLLARLDEPRDLDGLLVEAATSRPARRIGQGLVAAGLLVSPKRRLVRAVLAVLPLTALAVVGFATAPAGWQTATLPTAAALLAVVLLLGPPPVRTRHGARTYERATAGLAPVDPAEVTARYGLVRPAATPRPEPGPRRADTAVFDGETAEPIGYAGTSEQALPRRRRPAVVVEPRRWRKRNGLLVAGGWLAGGWLASQWLGGDDGGDFPDADFGGFGG